MRCSHTNDNGQKTVTGVKELANVHSHGFICAAHSLCAIFHGPVEQRFW